jgi:hypothetical protein
MNRLLRIVYIVFCLEMGVFLFIFPWISLWSRNYFVGHYPLFAAIIHNYFLRGAVSGLGLADVWLAMFEVWRFRSELGFGSSKVGGRL